MKKRYKKITFFENVRFLKNSRLDLLNVAKSPSSRALSPLLVSATMPWSSKLLKPGLFGSEGIRVSPRAAKICNRLAVVVVSVALTGEASATMPSAVFPRKWRLLVFLSFFDIFLLFTDATVSFSVPCSNISGKQ